jgi:hypothetical protein
METFTNYYAVLGVDVHASNDIIKAAFKKLALKYHPDVYKGEDAEERMRLILLAYQTLSDTDERRLYDKQHAGALGLELNGTGAARHSSSTPGASTPRAGGSSDGRFAFPTLDAAGAAGIDFVIEGFSYQLWPDDALLLKRNGILQGIAPDAKQGNSHYCHRCRHRWTAPAQASMRCPQCKAGDWAEYQLLRCSHCHAVFENHEIRDAIRGGIPYHPYELFPLCPNCRRSQWCASENERVDVLRAADARRRRLLLIATFVFLLVVVAVLFFITTMAH